MSEIDDLVRELVETVQFQDAEGNVVTDTGYIETGEDDEEFADTITLVGNSDFGPDGAEIPWIPPLELADE